MILQIWFKDLRCSGYFFCVPGTKQHFPAKIRDMNGGVLSHYIAVFPPVRGSNRSCGWGRCVFVHEDRGPLRGATATGAEDGLWSLHLRCVQAAPVPKPLCGYKSSGRMSLRVLHSVAMCPCVVHISVSCVLNQLCSAHVLHTGECFLRNFIPKGENTQNTEA